MLRRLRIQLTLLYLLAGIILVAVMGAWLYYRMADYFQTSTDLALKYRLAVELRSLAVPVSPELEEAEQDFIHQSESENNFPTPTPTLTEEEDHDEGSPEGLSPFNPPSSITPTLVSNPVQEKENTQIPETENESEVEEETNDLLPFSPIQLAKYQIPSSIPTANVEMTATPPVAVHTEPDLDDMYYSETVSIFVLNLDINGQMIPSLNSASVPISPDHEAVLAAGLNGTDIRRASMSNGTPIRLLTYRVPDGYQAEYIQLGQPIDDQVRLLNQYLINLMGISVVLLLLLGLGSWWLAGRSLVTTQRSLEQQQAFVANASHELRAPLTLIRASTELANRSIQPGETKELLKDVLHDVDYMNKLVEDLLLLSRLDHQRLQIQYTSVRVDTLLEDLSRQVKIITDPMGILLETTVIPVTILVDQDRLQQVLWILIDNAIQHTPPQGTIHLSVREAGKQAEIMVEDSGKGIPPEDLPHIFERFYKARSSPSVSRGAGLGLSIAQNLVTAQNGTIQINSIPEIGTQVKLSFPCSK